MLTTSKVKWFGSILLASILLILALIGGKWGTDYSASASVNATPIIQIPFSISMVPILGHWLTQEYF
jgi:TRAP-type C4-dicarboxylate transport system permease small subunit